ncbi:FAD-dependent oxidoreductase [Intrasporangium sp. YIM S08009]|uniref:FAD-dependent oxidoreductase n=1 Tax=Intrasporangium zincisolvens TaxID=3080018 RepID=UPI002B056418|nr:FAD-dependent monooxygenase [Intrasporangium sp. YIM S08009]
MAGTGQEAGRVVVVGASTAGLFTARALAGHVGQVVVLERERLPDEVRPRGRVPQGRHLHLLLSAGLDRLRLWFPGIEDELVACGAVPTDGSRAYVHQGGAYRARGDWGRPVLSLTRPLLESVVRARVAALSNVRVESGVRVERVALSEGVPVRVTGVVVEGVERPADLVVDCSGRSSAIAHDLAEAGVVAPPVTRVGIDIAYASCLLRRDAADFEGTFVVCQDNPGTFRGGAVLPVEGGRWQVTLAGVHGDSPGSTDASMREFARGLPTPVVAELLERCERVGDIETYRFPSSQRRHHERVREPVPGLVSLGDAACSFDPIYGQGMTSSALQAEALGRVVAEALARSDVAGLRAGDLPKRFYRKAARVIDAPCRIAVGGDFGHPATTGPRPPGSAALNAYVRRVVRASHSSVEVARAFNRVVQLADPPTALARPALVARVVRYAGRSPVATGTPVVHPRVGPPSR